MKNLIAYAETALFAIRRDAPALSGRIWIFVSFLI